MRRHNRRDELRPHFVYRCYDTNGALIYVGCSVNPKVRVEGHRLNAWWGDQIATTRNLVFPDADSALYRERKAIYIEKPRHNVKNRWYKGDEREHWTLDDYLHFENALDHVERLGERTARLILEVRAERLARFEAVAA